MELLARVAIAIVIVVVIVLAIYYGLQTTLPQNTQAQAYAWVKNWLNTTYPTANAAIINVTRSPLNANWWRVYASIVANATSPCPSYFIYYFDYPGYSFVNTTQNIYTLNCTIYGFPSSTPYLFSSPWTAITRSYMLGIPLIKNYVDSYGFKNVAVHASFFNKINAQGTNYTNVWLVKYSSNRTNGAVCVLLTQVNGNESAAYGC